MPNTPLPGEQPFARSNICHIFVSFGLMMIVIRQVVDFRVAQIISRVSSRDRNPAFYGHHFFVVFSYISFVFDC